MLISPSHRYALIAAIAALVVLPAEAVAVGAPAPAGGGPQLEQAGEAEPDFDLRAKEALRPEPLPPAVGAARAELRRSLGRQGILELDPVTGTVRFAGRRDGFLTAPSRADPATIALGFVADNLAALGLDAGDLQALRPAARQTSIGGITHLYWTQSADGIPSFEGGLQAAVDADGRLINLTGSPQPDLAIRGVRPGIGASGALAVAQRAGGESVALPPVSDREGGPRRVTQFGDGSEAGLVLFASQEGEIDLSWRVINVESSTEIYDTVVEASTGEVLRRENLVDFAAGNVWRYFPNAETQIAAGEGGDGGGPRALTSFPDGSPPGEPDWATETNRLFGSFAHVYTDVDDNADSPSSPDSPTQCGPGAQACGEVASIPGPNWDYTFNELAPGGNCGSPFPACSWDPGVAFSWNENVGQNGTQVYYYVSTFHDWLAAPPFGFTGIDAFEGNDRVDAQILDGAALNSGRPDGDHINNANMATFPGVDVPPRMQMYLFRELDSGDIPYINGGDDASVVYHEYTHGLSNRLVNSGPGQPALFGHQADSMGEGWSDWYALDYLEANDIDEDDREGPPDAGTGGGDNDGEMNVGYYTFGGDIHRLRTMGLDCAVGTSDVDCDDPSPNQAGTGGYTYGDMGKILCNAAGGSCRPEVHADGEIWGQALWDLRQRFREDLSPADFSDEHAAGLDRARALITEGMRLSPPDPSFLDMRDAILQADQALFGGADTGRIWDVFAARGMGYFAATLGTNDTNPIEDFSTPPDCGGGGCGTVSGRVTESESGAPVAGATVEFLGPGNLVGTTDPNGNYAIANVPPHTYPYVSVSAPAHQGQLRHNVGVGPVGGTLDLEVTRDWAALSGGASLTSFSGEDFSAFGCGPAAAFDLDLANGWGSTSPAAGGEKQVTVRLPLRVDVTSFAIDPGATCGDDDSASTGTFEVLTSQNGAAFTRAAGGTFTAADNHRLNELAPSAAGNGVQFVRFLMKSTQRGSTAGTSGASFMDVSEVEVWGRPAPALRCAGRLATLTGTAARNVINGTPGRDVIATLGGNDLIRGAGGRDLVCAGAGRDTVGGGGGDDDIRGAAGNDILTGAAGRDRLAGGTGRDRLNGGAGRDRLTGGPGNDRLSGMGGDDVCAGNGGRDTARACERRRSI